MRLSTFALVTVLGGSAVAVLGGCEEEGPAEKAGEKIDEAVEEAGEKIEEAGEKIQDATKKNP